MKAITLLIMTFFCYELITACASFVDIDSNPTEILSSDVFSDSETAESAVNGIYSRISSSNFLFSGSNSLTILCGLYADEFINFSVDQSLAEFYSSNVLPTNISVSNIWSEAYRYIYTANLIVEGLNESDQIENAKKDQLIGEALFLRAFCYFYLTSLYGDIPYTIQSDYQQNRILPRVSQTEVYQKIVEDLLFAKDILPSDFFASNERTRPNRWAAMALLSRVYLYLGNDEMAIEEATSIIAHATEFQLEDDLNRVFTKESREVIWQLMPVIPGFNSSDGRYLIFEDRPTIVSLSDGFTNSFEIGDLRASLWIDSTGTNDDVYYYPHKYRVQSSTVLVEYNVMFRIAELHLIRAEANLRRGVVSSVLEDINVLRLRANLQPVTTLDPRELFEIILKERRSELFCELGHRWLDLKRLDLADATLSDQKPSWNSSAIDWPIPQDQINNQTNLEQNPGY